MSLIKERRILTSLIQSNNLEVIHIITDQKNFETKFEGSISLFFRSLKNGLYSINGITNRQFFKGISGVYFSMENEEKMEIIIIYDKSLKTLNQVQVINRIRKLLGYNIEINFGEFSEYELKIRDMIGIRRKTQLFGDYYYNK